MTEHRPSYQASSQDCDQLHLLARRRAIVVPEFPPSKPDILLLVPVLQSPDAPPHDPVCRNPVSLPDGNLGLCNAKGKQICLCCGFGMCLAHTSTRRVLFPDEESAWSGKEPPPLCQTCAGMTDDQIYALHDFRKTLNYLSFAQINDNVHRS